MIKYDLLMWHFWNLLIKLAESQVLYEPANRLFIIFITFNIKINQSPPTINVAVTTLRSF